MNPAKRRRIDVISSTLRKPFRSPVKVLTDNQASPKLDFATGSDHQIPNPSPDSDTVAGVPSGPSPLLSSSNQFTTTKFPACSNIEVTDLSKQHTALIQELRCIRRDLDITQQAIKLRSGNQVDRLEQLVSKWQDIARSAADEVFEITSDRVKNMGGMKIWQKAEYESSSAEFFLPDHSQHNSHDEDKGQVVERNQSDGEEHPDSIEEEQEVSCNHTFVHS